MPNTRSNNERIRELESQLRAIQAELVDLVKPTDEERAIIQSGFEDNLYDLEFFLDDDLFIVRDVLDQREVDEEEAAHTCDTCGAVLQGPGKSLGCEECNTAYCSDGCLNQHMVISGHGDSGQPEPEEVSDAS